MPNPDIYMDLQYGLSIKITRKSGEIISLGFGCMQLHLDEGETVYSYGGEIKTFVIATG